MLQFFSEHLFPTNPIALGIITFLIGFFSVWLIGLIIYWRWLWTERKQIENNQNIQPLVTARQDQYRGRENNTQKADPENVFSEFCKEPSLNKRSPIARRRTRVGRWRREPSLNKRSPIAKHLKAIFLAGWDETRLEVGELINHTTSELFKWNSFFRSMLAVFIVIGLLGTLFGLADSLTELSPALKANGASEISIENNQESAANETSTENSEKMTQALGKLLDKMKGALAPSIFGILFTILGVILYGAYLQFACHSVKSILERSTLTVWIPQLYPTTSQKLIQTLHESEVQMRSGYQTAAQVGELVGNVQSNISEFNENLTRANAITQPLSDSVSQINVAAGVFDEVFTRKLKEFLGEFTENVTRLTNFQVEIRNLYQQLKDESQTFQKGAHQKLDAQTQKLEDQTQNLVKVLTVLEKYEKLYIDTCQQIDGTLQKFINKTTKASTNIATTNREFLEEVNATNREWIAEIQSQLKTELAIIQPTLKEELKALTCQLTSDLKEVQRVQDERLKALTDQLKFFEAPIKQAADQIAGIIENFTGIMERIVNSLQSEFQKQHKVIERQNKNYAEQLTEVKSLNASVENLLKQLDESSKKQKEAVNALSSNVGGLTTDIKNLDVAINSFTSDSGTLSQSIEKIEEHTKTLSTTSQQFVEKVEKADVTPLNVNIERLNTIIGDISQNSQTLAITVSQLKTQINSSGTGELGHRRKKRSVFSKLNPFSRKKTDGR